MHIPTFLSTALLAGLALAHPGHDHTQELRERAEFLSNNKNDLSHCAGKMKARGLHAANIKRRSAFGGGLLKKRGLEGRQTFTPREQESHESQEEYTARTDPSVLFAGNASCVLSPEQIEGPYYVAGEYIRQDITDNENGVPLAVDIQVIDMDTCEPIPNIYLEIWHCNSTGVYGGVVAQGNGNGAADPANLNNTMLRGAQKTDKDGAVQFHTLFPGHYIGRTTHIHVAVHLNATAQPNGTLHDLTAAHVGQIYFDQELIDAVEKTSPYTENTQVLTTNAQDFLLQQAAATSDPFLEWVYLGEKGELAEGLLSWISFGINVTLAREMYAASTLTENGGVANPAPGGGFPGGGFPGGGFPGGGFPPGFTFPPGAPGFPTGGLPTASPLPSGNPLPTVAPLIKGP
ncbi:Intradiol ring-cleavage dioxygenase [Naviculisporaceae sp. PSN 640]